jgi:hypothetical protein
MLRRWMRKRTAGLIDADRSKARMRRMKMPRNWYRMRARVTVAMTTAV